jgi:2-dehydro-3-deoxyphosphogluconate aldolase / (4S)-4-hydroxy-2-oxoglutarate aldolase
MLNNHWSIQAAELLRISPVIPVVVIDSLADALPIAQALAAGGVRIMEITLRTPCALVAIQQLREQMPEMVIGAGTVLNEQQLLDVVAAGAQFAVSPGAPLSLLTAAWQGTIPFLPGIANSTDILNAMALGYRQFKFFPAEALGGVPMLKALTGPFAEIEFCATGGITPVNFESYLQLPQVPCVGGSWLTASAQVSRQDWQGIRANCQALARSEV